PGDSDEETPVETQPSGDRVDDPTTPDSSDVDMTVCICVLLVSVVLLVCCVGGAYEKKVH
ncbi:MAG: hypothetical protein II290_06020, partial [Oscillospiraceae bacterium]|nr:hypothetical protein [Oscillospiraceae bacterium]